MIQAGALADSHGRALRDLRISVTDRCNFRCLYCLPENEAAQNFYQTRFAPGGGGTAKILREWQPHSNLLTFEEIERVARLAVSLGIRKIRLTGGERLAAKISDIPGLEDLAMTTNGFLFKDKAAALREAGLRRVTFSLDSLDRENFRKITGRDGLDSVLEGIALARRLGFAPVKVNAVIIRGLNDNEIPALARFAFEEGLILRFIEFMPLDSSRAWQKDLVVTGREMLARARESFPLTPLALDRPSETSRRWSLPGGAAEIGVISPVSEPFCGHCDRLRLTADGKIRTCLFSLEEHDLRARLRKGDSEAELTAFLREVVSGKEEGHRIGSPGFVQPSRTMSCIGG
jgi:cyclic pyranopterin phosphate synthase